MTQRFILQRNKESLTFNSSLERGCIMKLKYVSIALAALVASTVPAQAAITIYTTAASFAAATTAPGVDTFTGFSITSSTPSPITRTAGAYGYTGTVSTTTFFGGGTSANPFLSTNTATDTMTFNAFTGGVEAAGGNFFGSDISGTYALGDLTITATDGSGTVTQSVVGATTSTFIGFVSTGPLTSVTVTSVQPAGAFLWPSLDNFVLAKRAGAVVPQVPESSTWLMMIAGFGFIGGAMRRRTTARIAQAI
jgi:hypothetical protein